MYVLLTENYYDLEQIANDTYFFMESGGRSSGGVLTRLWAAIKKAIIKIREFFIGKSQKNVETEMRSNGDKVVTDFDIKAASNAVDKQIAQTEKNIKTIEQGQKQEKRMMSNLRAKIQARKDRKANAGNSAADDSKYTAKEKEMAALYGREIYSNVSQALADDRKKDMEERVVSKGVKCIVTTGVAAAILFKCKKQIEKLNAQDSAIRRIYNTARTGTPNGEKAAKSELSVIARITTTIHQIMHECTKKTKDTIKKGAKEFATQTANQTADAIRGAFKSQSPNVQKATSAAKKFVDDVVQGVSSGSDSESTAKKAVTAAKKVADDVTQKINSSTNPNVQKAATATKKVVNTVSANSNAQQVKAEVNKMKENISKTVSNIDTEDVKKRINNGVSDINDFLKDLF